MRPFLPLLLVLGACHSATSQDTPDAAVTSDAAVDAATGCAPGLAGAGCVLALYDQGAAGCDPATIAKLRTELDARAKQGPLWSAGRALFRTQAPINVAGGFNNWDAAAFATAQFCQTDLVLGVTAVASGFWPYKLVSGGTWTLDPTNPAFAYDDFAGNADHRNSVLDTPDSGRGHLVTLDQACSTALGNCRNVTAYLPPAYDADNRTYPVLFMHDGKNVWDDHTCCFGHTGWEINVTLDAEIAAGRVAPIIVIAADQTAARNDEYGLSLTTMNSFIAFQVNELQPHALSQVRGDGGRVYIAGSSLGGLVSMELALRKPQTYAGVASLSGAFWPNNSALRDEIPGLGKQALAIYVDSGGNPADNSDGAQDTIEVRDHIVALGWVRADSPTCTPGPDALCYHLEPGATHDELAWKARAWRFLRYLFPA
ncbi:MAG: Endo,4-beta-xylanase/feruloyl esterase precursor [Myxococcales bacterium]|nr:Endo,4-beta-xylanase/feruloyl esterase precursor [Myxococcales bacterium]